MTMQFKVFPFILVLVAISFALTVYDSVGTSSNPAHCCDTNSIYVKIFSPSGQSSTTLTGFSYVSSSGTCGSTPTVTETWQRANSCTFCPEEGTYTIYIYPNIDRRVTATDSGCPNTATEVSNQKTFWTVNYDNDQNWCACKTGAGTNYLVATDGNNGNCCGDDGVNDVFESAGAGNSACVEGETVAHNSVSSDGRYLVIDGEMHYCTTGAWGTLSSSGCSTLQRGMVGNIIMRFRRFKVFFGHSPYSFVTNWYSCDRIGDWYCAR